MCAGRGWPGGGVTGPHTLQIHDHATEIIGFVWTVRAMKEKGSRGDARCSPSEIHLPFLYAVCLSVCLSAALLHVNMLTLRSSFPDKYED
jgi:hypothetical protein